MRERGIVVVAGIAAALLAGVAGQASWYRAGSHSWSGAALSSGLTWTLAAAAIAGFVVAALLHGVALRLVGALLMVLALLVVAAPMTASAPTDSLLNGVTSAELSTGATQTTRWLYSVGGAAVFVAATWLVARGGHWSRSDSRFRRDPSEAGRTTTSRDMWAAQDAGIDPTDD